MKIRYATIQDSQIVFSMLQQLASYEKMLNEFFADEKTLSAVLFDPQNNFKAILAEEDGKVVGMAIFYISFVTFLAGKGLFLEDLFVPESYRGRGYGKSILKYLAGVALENQCVRMEWNVLKWNKKAIDFYESLEAKPLSDWVTYRMEKDAILKLRDGAQS